jgi:hypothetical protein
MSAGTAARSSSDSAASNRRGIGDAKQPEEPFEDPAAKQRLARSVASRASFAVIIMSLAATGKRSPLSLPTRCDMAF